MMTYEHRIATCGSHCPPLCHTAAGVCINDVASMSPGAHAASQNYTVALGYGVSLFGSTLLHHTVLHQAGWMGGKTTLHRPSLTQPHPNPITMPSAEGRHSVMITTPLPPL